MTHIIAVLALLGLTAKAVYSEVPHLISYQGQLTDDVGNPIDTTVDMTFALFNDSLGTTKYWEEVHPDVNVVDGLFEVRLGSIVSLNTAVLSSAECWLGISLDGGAVMQPMTPMTSMLYACRADRSDTADYASTAGHAATSDHADTADIALGGAVSGWVDAGNVVRLSTATDSVGIGTSNPRVPLEVQGSVTAIIGESHGSGLSFGVHGGNDNDGIGVMGTSNDGRGVSGISITGFGGHFYGPKSYVSTNLGIGTESPGEMLHVYKNSSGGASYMKVQADHATNWGEAGLRFQTPQNTWHFRMDDDANNNMPAGGLGLRSHNLDAEVMTWKENGNVGIGTTTPNYPLEVVSSGYAFRARSTGSGIGVYASSVSGFGVYSDAPENFMGGLTGFGQTNPTHRITVNGAIGLQQSGATKFHINCVNGGFNIVETTVADYRLFIEPGGDVGIGTGNPTKKLHVNGDLKVADTLFAAALSPDVVNADNIVDEPGLVGSSGWADTRLGSSWITVSTRTIEVPGPGYILALVSAHMFADHTGPGRTTGYIGITDTPGSLDEWSSYQFNVPDPADQGWYDIPASCHELFVVNSAGTYEYYFEAWGPGDNDMTILQRCFSLLYVPTAYGTVSKSTKSGSSSPRSMVPSNPSDRQRRGDDIKSSIEMNNSNSMEDKMEALLAEIEQLKRKVESLEKE